MPKRLIVNSLVLSTAIIIGVGPYVVKAAGFHAESGATANVDLQRVYMESDAHTKAEERVRDFGIKLGQRFDTIQKLQFLSAEEISDLSVSLNVDKPTDVETKKIAEITKVSATRASDFQNLSSKLNLTDPEKKHLNELSGYQQTRGQVTDRLSKLYQSAVDQEEAKQNRQGLAEIRAIVAKVAKDQGISQVFDTSSMIVAQVDLTEASLKKAASKKKP